MTAWLLVLLATTPVDGGVKEPMVYRSLDKDLIRRVTRANSARVRHCYEATLTTKPGASGKVSQAEGK